MNRTEAHTLILSARYGDTAARDNLIAYYCSTLIPGLARDWTRLDFDEACAIGNLATVEAVDAALKTYDASQEAGIAAYVRQSVVRALSQASYALPTIPGPTKPTSADTPQAIGIEIETADTAPNPEQSLIRAESRQRLRELFTTLLSERDAAVMTGLYFDDLGVWGVGQRLALSERTVTRIRSNALSLLRNHSEIRLLLSE